MKATTATKPPLTHRMLCDLAVNWLKRPHSRGGHGCQVAVTECRSGYDGEIPDAIGGSYTGAHTDGSIVVECKTSRADFLADRAKPHRYATGMGNWRYFFAPEGLISPGELPPQWGLVEVGKRGKIQVIVGAYTETNYYNRIERLIASRHATEFEREMFILVRLFNRISNAHEGNHAYRELIRKAARAQAISTQLNDAKTQIYLLEQKIEELQLNENTKNP